MSGSAEHCPTEDYLCMFVQGALDDPAAERVRKHAEGCPECGRRLIDAVHLQNTANTLAKYPKQRLDDERVERWMETVSKELAELDSADG